MSENSSTIPTDVRDTTGTDNGDTTDTWICPVADWEGPDVGELIGDEYEGSEERGVRFSTDLELARFCDTNGMHEDAAMLRRRHHRTEGENARRARIPARARQHQSRRTHRTAEGPDAKACGGDEDGDVASVKAEVCQ
jgi:hypothetical protein